MSPGLPAFYTTSLSILCITSAPNIYTYATGSCEIVNEGIVTVKYVPSRDMLADGFTKPLPRELHHDHCARIGLLLQPKGPSSALPNGPLSAPTDGPPSAPPHGPSSAPLMGPRPPLHMGPRPPPHMGLRPPPTLHLPHENTNSNVITVVTYSPTMLHSKNIN